MLETLITLTCGSIGTAINFKYLLTTRKMVTNM